MTRAILCLCRIGVRPRGTYPDLDATLYATADRLGLVSWGGAP